MDHAFFTQFQSRAEGLTDKEISERLAKFGPNILKEKKKKSLILEFLEEFKDLMIIILIIAAGISFYFGDRKDAIVIMAIVVVNAIIGFVQKFKAEKAIESLKKLLTPKARVLRDGEEHIIPSEDLVPGDILIINAGDKISADCVLFEVNELYTVESALTGESVPVHKLVYEHVQKKIPSEMKIFMGTSVAGGTAKALVIATGMDTEFGKIAKLTTETKKEKTPLQKELNHLGIFIGKITFVMVILLILGGIFVQGKNFVDTLIFAVSVAVAAVPEGLPVIITISLALGVQRLAKKNAIIRQLASVETLGSTTVICSDKTGTLTKDEMTVKEIVLDSYHGTVHGVGYEPKGHLFLYGPGLQDIECDADRLMECQTKHPDVFGSLERLSEIAGLCNNSHLSQKDVEWNVLGDTTEGALLVLIEKIGFTRQMLQKKWRKIYEIPFDSDRKRMTVIVADDTTGRVMAFTKGAPETMLPLSGNLDEKMKTDLHAKNEEMAGRALRMIGFAWKALPAQIQKSYKKEEVEKDLHWVGMVGMIDPPREEVKEAVKLTKKAGIKIYIVTGDHGLTAHAIARELGIVGSFQVRIVTGDELEKMPDKKLTAIFDEGKEIIFARVSPSHKLRIVQTLMEKGEVVAVTGDGVNDAPALKKADIGVAMGITGTDVSKETANMVLADDSFATIVTAIKEGRVIYENLRKFIFYVLSSNISEVVIVFAAIFFKILPPLTAVLILAVNVGTDIFPAIALGVEPSEPDIMDRKPRNPKSRIMNKHFVSRFLFIGIFMGIVVTAAYFWALYHRGFSFGDHLTENSIIYKEAATFAFAILVMMEMVNTFNARSDRQSIFKIPFFSNPKLLWAIFASVLLTVAFVHIPILNHWLDTLPLDLYEWGVIVVASFSVLLAEEIRKYGAKRSVLYQ